MDLEFAAVMPIGARTCCDLPRKSGEFRHTWLDADVPEFVAEDADLRRGQLDGALARRHHLDVVAQLGSLMSRAARGQLPVGTDRKSPARVIRRVPYLLELRPALTSHRVFRLYYAEPADVDASLLPLVLRTKQASSDNVEQNEAIDEAKLRSRKWNLYRVMGGKK